ncbi:unnamed protein product [Tuwongella immobilis]|uniref:Uncharacterized protein n=1 Tax=Tuwongella immobilis TaxID=692036 RepID=A0A6C2YN96_9BACT|nr:unnamed protein product [Tuwongella immobilis]VTS03357.1 unnamed protein product [Tuwongella immobilis]
MSGQPRHIRIRNAACFRCNELLWFDQKTRKLYCSKPSCRGPSLLRRPNSPTVEMSTPLTLSPSAN